MEAWRRRSRSRLRCCDFCYIGVPNKAEVCESNVTALLGGAALFIPGCRVQFLSRAKRFRPPYIGIPPYSDRFIGGLILSL